ncbi:MAG: hypothetical protein JSU72_15590 [Deltaproteobacteria bacterium]|nr:MAG: hypothetical protein JSU72_15590 [Deltaproteobacteria bacterium]
MDKTKSKLIHVICFCITLFALSFITTQARAAALNLNDQWGDKGSTVTFEVSVDTAPNEVEAFGFEVRYDSSVLRYQGYTTGWLTLEFDFVDANNASPGAVRVGGFEAGGEKIEQGDSGTLVSLTFEVVGHDDCQIRLSRLRDNIKTWSTRHGNFTGDHAFEEESDNPVDPPIVAGGGGSDDIVPTTDVARSDTIDDTTDDTNDTENTHRAQPESDMIHSDDRDDYDRSDLSRDDTAFVSHLEREEMPTLSEPVEVENNDMRRGSARYSHKNTPVRHSITRKTLPNKKDSITKEDAGVRKKKDDHRTTGDQMTVYSLDTTQTEKAHTGGRHALLGFFVGCFCWEFVQRVWRKVHERYLS